MTGTISDVAAAEQAELSPPRWTTWHFTRAIPPMVSRGHLGRMAAGRRTDAWGPYPVI
jgi:hypothetical protein